MSDRSLNTPRWLPERMAWWLAAGVVLITLTAMVNVAILLDNARRLYEHRAEQSTQNLALGIEKDIAGAVRAGDFLLQTVADEFYRQRAEGGVDPARLNRFIDRVLGRYPTIDAVRLTDAAGLLRYGTDVSASHPIDVSDRSHFRTLREENRDQLVISRPQVSRVNGMRVVVLARRLVDGDGHFGGMIFAAISITDLSAGFLEVELARGMRISLHGADLGLIAAHPVLASARDDESDVEMHVPKRELQQLRVKSPHGTIRAATPDEDEMRIWSYRRVAHYPLYVIVSRAKSEYLESWQAAVRNSVFMLAGFAALTYGLSWLVYFYWRQMRHANASLDRMARHDFLTELLNRRAFLTAAEVELQRARRFQTSPSLLMIDIDYFKRINDTRGHHAGDLVLQRLAAVLRGTMREIDLLCRWGGEEFAVLLPETTASGARDVAERLREEVERNEVAADDGKPPIRMTVSVGMASLGDQSDTLDALIARADDALYRAKNGGRNRVSV